MDAYSNSATRQALHGLFRAGGWLAGCVAALIDVLSEFRESESKPAPVVMPGASGLELFVLAGDGSIDFASPFAVGQDAALPGLAALPQVVLRFGTDRAVVKEIAVPASALDVLPAVIGNKIEGMAPWPLPGAIWGFRVLEPATAGQIEVEVGIISRKLLDSTLLDVASAGLGISHAEIGDARAGAPGILLDFRRPERQRKWNHRVRHAAAAVSMLFLAVAGFGLYRCLAAESELTQIEERAANLQQTLLGNAVTSVAGAKLAAANKLYARKRDTPPLASILNDLTRLVPDTAWLNSFEYSSAVVTIVGHGFNVTGLIDELEASPRFESVNFAAATQRDPATGTDIFAISAGVAGGQAAP